MTPFAIRKLYVDVIDDQGTVWIFYFVEVRLLFHRTRLAGVERYALSGASFHRAATAPAWPREPGRNETLAFRLDLPEGPIEFSGRSLLPPWTPDGPLPSLPFTWRLVAPRLAVTLRFPNAPAPITGFGYADHVELNGLPRSLGLRHLRWGRVHGPTDTFVFTSVTPQRGSPWRRAAHWQSERGFDAWHNFDLNETSDGLTFHPQAPPAGSIFLGCERTLRRGGAIDAGRFPRLAERALYRLLMGRTAEARWAGQARLDDDSATAIHESVDFG